MFDLKSGISINISTSTILKFLAILVVVYFLFLIKGILALLFVALIFSSAIDPFVDWMQQKKIPRPLGILFIYFSIFALVGLIIYLITPPIVEQVKDLAANFPYYTDKILSSFSSLKEYSEQHGFLDNIKNAISSMSNQLQGKAGNVFSTIFGIFGGIFSFFLVLVLTFYMTVEENAIKKVVWSIAPEKHQLYTIHLINRMQQKIGLWLRGELILMISIFVLDYIGLTILGVKYALVLSLIAGVMEFIPYVGPAVGAIPAIFLAFTQAPMLALFVAALYYIIQLVENNILVPKIMQKAVGLHPIMSITALLIGFKIGGVVGAILSIPVATALGVAIKDVFDHKEGVKISPEA